MERETGFEPATLALARRCSTTELFPPRSQEKRNYTGITREASRRGDGERSTTGQPAGWARLASSHRLANGRPGESCSPIWLVRIALCTQGTVSPSNWTQTT